MQLSKLLFLAGLTTKAFCDTSNRQPLSYTPLPAGVYVPSKPAGVTTLLDFVKSRDDLTILESVLAECGGKKLFPLPVTQILCEVIKKNK